MIKRINSIIAAVREEHGVDWRTCYASVRPAERPGASIVVECSDAGVLEDVSERVASELPDALGGIELVHLPRKEDRLSPLCTVSGSVADVRREPSHGAELLTQAICGDSLIPLEVAGDWVLVRMDDGYVGWVRSWNIRDAAPGELEDFRSKAKHRIAANIVQLRSEPRGDALPSGEAVVGTPVLARACSRRGWREIILPDGRRGFIKSSKLEKRPSAKPGSRAKLANTGLRFLGIPYVWGGTTPKGFDCSGLMQRIFRLHGVLIPRDSDMQARFGKLKTALTPDELATGDLLFFGKEHGRITHVGMYLSNGLYLHAYGFVRVASLDPGNPLFDSKLARMWRFSRDPLCA
jgi:SH3-like domain-containing protein